MRKERKQTDRFRIKRKEREGQWTNKKRKKEGKGISGLCQNKDTSAQRLSEYGKSICDRRNHLCDRAVFYEFL